MLLVPGSRGLPVVLWDLCSLQHLSGPILLEVPLTYGQAVVFGSSSQTFLQVLPDHQRHLRLPLILVSLLSSRPFLLSDPRVLVVLRDPNKKA